MHGGIPIPEAAAALGISERTVRRRIKDGDLSAYEIHTARGMAWRVVLPVVQGGQGGGSAAPEQPSTALATVDKRVDRDQVLGALLMEMAQRIEALELLVPEYGPPDPGPPVVLPRDEYPTEIESQPEGGTTPPSGLVARFWALWEGGA